MDLNIIKDRLGHLERLAHELLITQSRLPVREAKLAAIRGNIIMAQVNEALGVGAADPTFDFDEASVIVGTSPPGGVGEAQNQYQQTYADNEIVILYQLQEDGEWYTERGGTAGSIVRRVEATAAKDWNTPSVGGVLLDASDVPVGGAITLTDRAPSKHQCLEGARGYALHAGGTNYYIITLDAPARWVEGTLGGTWTLDETYGYLEITDYWGASPNHQQPVTETHNFGGGETGLPDDIRDVLKVYDPCRYRTRKLANGERLQAVWDEKREKWYLWAAPAPYITIKFQSPGVARTDATFSVSIYEAVNGALPSGTLTVTNDPKCNCPAGQTMYARFNQALNVAAVNSMWDTGDGGNTLWHLRGYLDWSDSASEEEARVLECYGEIEPHWHGAAACDESPGA